MSATSAECRICSVSESLWRVHNLGDDVPDEPLHVVADEHGIRLLLQVSDHLVLVSAAGCTCSHRLIYHEAAVRCGELRERGLHRDAKIAQLSLHLSRGTQGRHSAPRPRQYWTATAR